MSEVRQFLNDLKEVNDKLSYVMDIVYNSVQSSNDMGLSKEDILHNIQNQILTFDTLDLMASGVFGVDHFQDDIFTYNIERIICYLLNCDNMYLDKLYNFVKLRLNNDMLQNMSDTYSIEDAENFMDRMERGG